MSFFLSFAMNGGSQQCSRTIREALWQPCIVSNCNSDVRDVVIRILGQECHSKYVGAAVSSEAPQKDVDRIGGFHYILGDFCTQTLIGLFTPRELLTELPQTLV